MTQNKLVDIVTIIIVILFAQKISQQAILTVTAMSSYNQGQ